MQKTFSKRINKNAAATLCVIASAVAAVSGNCCSRSRNTARIDASEEILCGSQAEIEATSGPIAETSGFGISDFGKPGLPITPPNGPTLNIPTYYYRGPNLVPYYEQPVFVKDYFRNLETNYPTNNVENCGYVAAAMLLGYYDTYWNPDFIPDQYNNEDLTELDSLEDRTFDCPGVKDIYEELHDSDYRDYIYRMLARQDESFIALLYQNAIDIGLLDPENKPTLRTTIQKVAATVNNYIANNSTLAGKVIMDYMDLSRVEGNTETRKRNNLRKLAIERLKAGQPIIFGGRSANKVGHICIAYDYIEEGNKIIIHCGWKGENCSAEVSWSHLYYFDDFAFLDISPELRTIPYNKRFKVGTKAFSCHDLDSFVHKEVAVPYEDDEYHAIQCSCGEIKYEKHNFISLSSDTKKCTKCGKVISRPNWSN